MIKNITKLFKNIGSKLLIIVIALSFAIWGVGDIFVNNNNNPTVASVGNSEIKLKEFQLDYQLLINSLRQTNQQPITEDLLKALGVHHNVIDNLISKKFINILSKDLDIKIDDGYIKKSIVNNPLFKDQLGIFNKDYYDFFLNRNNLKEKDLYNITKDSLGNDLLLKSMEHSQFVPRVLVNNIIKKRDLVRKAKIFTFDTSSKLISDKDFNDAVIQQKYDKEKANFLDPETRDISIISFIYKDLEDEEVILDEELVDFYEKNIDLFKKKESRNIYVVQFKSNEEMVKFKKIFKEYGGFFETLKKFDIDKENSNLGNIIFDDLETNIGNEVFSLAENQLSKTYKTSFGYKAFYLEKINKESLKKFAEVKSEIKKDLLKEKVNEKIYNTANIFYEKFIQTKNLSSSINNLSANINKIKKISLKNINEIKDLNVLDINKTEITKLIFNLKKNDISEIIEDKNNNLHYLYLDNVRESKEKPLAEIKDDIIKLLYDEERNKTSKNLANEFMKTYDPNTDVKKIRGNYFNVRTTEWITLDSRLGKEIDQKIKKLIFDSKLNKISKVINLKKGVHVVVLPTKQSKNILNDDQKSNIDTILMNLNNSIEADINTAILDEMSKMYKSNVNQQFLNSF